MQVTIIREGEVQIIGGELVGCTRARDGRAMLARKSVPSETDEDLRRFVARERRSSKPRPEKPVRTIDDERLSGKLREPERR